MSLSDQLQTLATARPNRGPQCVFVSIFDKLSETDADALRAALANQSITSVGIANALSESGHKVISVTVARHRKRGQATGCRCES